MCGTCGCSDGAKATLHDGSAEHSHVLPDGSVVRHHHGHDHHGHDHHGHDHHENGRNENGLHHEHPGGHGAARTHGPAHAKEIQHLELQVLQKNDQLAARNRGFFAGREVLALNLMSSPGAGKTTLLARVLREIGGEVGVLEGDQETENDAKRLRETGAKVIQINTGTGCHLEADMVWAGLQQLKLPVGATLFIENVGNLVCPALFDLGEDARIVLFSVTEGEDKPLKYPHMFRSADLVLLTKIDLLPHLEFDVEQAARAVHTVVPDAPLLHVSAKSGQGLQALYSFIHSRRSEGRIALGI